MNNKVFSLIFSVLTAAIFSIPAVCQNITTNAAQPIYMMDYNGPVDVPHTDYMLRVIGKAEKEGAQLVIIRLNTPGGQLEVTKNIVERFLNSKIPIVVYVTPRGAWAGSAGVFITMSAHIAAMTPGTNIGSASPVSGTGENIDEDMRAKVRNMSAAWIRSIAEQRGRNAAWGEDAIYKAVAATEGEALKNNVIDLIAENQNELIQKINDREIKMADGRILKLAVTNAPVKEIPMTPAEKFLILLVNPYILIILGTIAVAGIAGEIYNPGTIFPGVTGSIALLLVLYGGSFLPVNVVGLAFIILSVALFIFDIYATTHGVLTVGGVISLFLGLTMLFRSDFGAPTISPVFAGGVALMLGGFFAFIISAAVKAQFRKKETGAEGMIGKIAEVRKELNPMGQVMLDGTHWTAILMEGDAPAGSYVIVERIDGLKLFVKPTSSISDQSQDNKGVN